MLVGALEPFEIFSLFRIYSKPVSGTLTDFQNLIVLPFLTAHLEELAFNRDELGIVSRSAELYVQRMSTSCSRLNAIYKLSSSTTKGSSLSLDNVTIIIRRATLVVLLSSLLQ